MRFLPREVKFFEYFLEQAKIIVKSAQLLHSSAIEGPESLRHAALEITRLETKGDEIIHEVFTRLNQTFITPIDPEDIHSLGSCLDDVLDAIEESAHRIVAYRVDPIPPAVVDLCGVIENCAIVLVKAFEALAADKPMLDHCIEINRLEDHADVLVRAAIADLFENEKDPIALIKLKEIYEYLEGATDSAEDVADALQNVIVKNS
jgi:predicted phosphate transport protein (TIGR00153 family)